MSAQYDVDECHEYNPKGSFRPGTGCFEATCRYKPAAPPRNEVRTNKQPVSSCLSDFNSLGRILNNILMSVEGSLKKRDHKWSMLLRKSCQDVISPQSEIRVTQRNSEKMKFHPLEKL